MFYRNQMLKKGSSDLKIDENFNHVSATFVQTYQKKNCHRKKFPLFESPTGWSRVGGSCGRVVASDSRGQQFESRQQLEHNINQF